jgi:hypothetical protein
MVRYIRVALACVVSGVFVLGVAALPAVAGELGSGQGGGLQRSVGYPKETPPPSVILIPGPATPAP